MSFIFQLLMFYIIYGYFNNIIDCMYKEKYDMKEQIYRDIDEITKQIENNIIIQNKINNDFNYNSTENIKVCKESFDTVYACLDELKIKFAEKYCKDEEE